MRNTLLFLVGVMLVGCSSQSSGTVPYRIAVIPKGTTHDHWKAVRAGALQAARELGDTEILWDGPSKEDERGRQQEIMERFANTPRVHGIVLAPCDKTTLIEPTKTTLAKQKYVVLLDSDLEARPEIQDHPYYLGYVATNNREGGRAAARRVLELVQNKPSVRIMMIRYQRGSESTEQREAGFREVIEEAQRAAGSGPGARQIELLEPNDEAGATVSSAQPVVERLLQKETNLDVLFMPNESSTAGALAALEALNKIDKILLVGFDMSSTLIHGMKQGKIQGLVLQDPFDMGYQAVKRIHDKLQGKPRQGDMVFYTGLAMLTRDNMEDPKLKQLYARQEQLVSGK
ncbi:MAG TPA: substrate-binding domain-containing protein [Gemmatales bacterium]|nr:substrate-binding domain-containing protein [Gemmatales bacterium]HMP17060.1 substrate-binding domain-containing protein [Gemmatales bacterium]